MNENITGNNNVHTPAEPAVLNDPLRNRGVAFTPAEREALGLTGRLPSGVLTLEEQARRAWQQLQTQGDDLLTKAWAMRVGLMIPRYIDGSIPGRGGGPRAARRRGNCRTRGLAADFGGD